MTVVGEHVEKQFGRCRTTAVIGQGPLTIVYRAIQDPVERVVAVKALRDTIAPNSPLAKHLEREADILATLQHPGVVALHDFVQNDEATFMILELVDGATLGEVLEKLQGGIDLGAAIAITRGIAEALAHVHERGVVHRDIRPENILLGRDGAVKITDFGIAHDARLPTLPEPTSGGSGYAMPSYMSPEQVLGDEVDARSDLFSLGVVLHQMLAGAKPFDAPDARSVTQRIRHDAPTPLKAGSPEAIRIVERCLEKVPDHRFADANELLLALPTGDAGTPQEVVGLLLRAGVITERPSLARAIVAKPRPAASTSSVARAAIVYLVLLGAMVAGGIAIQGAEGDARGGTELHGDTLELVPDHGGAIRVVARPWATVYVDGQLIDVTPFAKPIPVRVGSHQVRLTHPASSSVERTVSVAAAETAFVDVEMAVPAPPEPPAPSVTAAPTSSTP